MKRIIVVVCIVAMGLFLAPSVTHAAVHQVQHPQVSCSGIGCNGASPSATGCNAGSYYVKSAGDAILKDPRSGFRLGDVQLVWSPTCKTNWAHVHVDTSVYYNCSNEAQTNPQNSVYTYIAYGCNGAFDSTMVYSPSTFAQACGYIYIAGGNWVAANCTQYS